MTLLHSGSFIFVRDTLNEVLRELHEAEEMSDEYSFTDLRDLVLEAIEAQDALYDQAIENGMISV